MLPSFSSQITFLYFQDYQSSSTFLDRVFGLEVVFNPGWAKVYRVCGPAFLGAVDASRGSVKDLPERKGVLISLTVKDAGEWRSRLEPMGLEAMTEMTHFEDLGLQSFFFDGPEGYRFEIQEFLDPQLRDLF